MNQLEVLYQTACFEGDVQNVEACLLEFIGRGIYQACKAGEMSVLEYFFKSGYLAVSNPTPTQIKLANAGLRGAAAGGHLDYLKFMLSLGAVDVDGAIAHAVKENHVIAIQILVQHGGFHPTLSTLPFHQKLTIIVYHMRDVHHIRLWTAIDYRMDIAWAWFKVCNSYLPTNLAFNMVSNYLCLRRPINHDVQ